MITHANGSGGVSFYLRLSVCLSVFPHNISKTKLDTEMFQDEYWKPIYSEVRRSKVKVTRHKASTAWVFAHL